MSVLDAQLIFKDASGMFFPLGNLAFTHSLPFYVQKVFCWQVKCSWFVQVLLV